MSIYCHSRSEFSHRKLCYWHPHLLFLCRFCVIFFLVFNYIMVFQTIPKNEKNEIMYRNALIHNTSCDSQDLSLICSLFFVLVLFVYSILLVGSVPTSSVKPAWDEASMMETSESRACFDTGAITENGICITLLSVKLSRWKRLYPPLGP